MQLMFKYESNPNRLLRSFFFAVLTGQITRYSEEGREGEREKGRGKREVVSENGYMLLRI